MKNNQSSSNEHPTPLSIEDNLGKCPDKSELVFGTLNSSADLTVCVPVFGIGKFLRESLLSVIDSDQTNLKIQIVISDNKPYDPGQNPFPLFLSNLPSKENVGLAYFHVNRNLGILNNFNRAIFLSPTRYVCMQHDDDLMCHDYFTRLEKLLPWIKKHPDVGMIHGRLLPFSHERPVVPLNKNAIRRITKTSVTSLGVTGTGIPSCGFFVDRELFFATGGFNETYKASGDAFPAAIMLNNRIKVFEFTYFTGLYRIDSNGSLKLDVCQRFIREDHLFYQEWKKTGGWLRKLYMKWFETIYYSTNIDGKVGLFGPLNPEITTQSLDFLHRYKHYGPKNLKRVLMRLFIKTSAFIRARTAHRF